MDKKSSMASLLSDEDEYDFLEISSSSEEDDDLGLFLSRSQSLSHWELISTSDADNDYDSEEPKQEKRHQKDHQDEDNGFGSSPVNDQIAIEPHGLHFLEDGYGDFDDDDDDDDAYALNDELVPWSVNEKFRRQRMRKLGKRGFTKKMSNSKRSPYLFVRPGAVRGKHGLGFKHSF
ncbi:hypothetical protein L484_004127 [Morus notabilis]|uniref:Uncharacterized protein n=1 Tax=Morus notabilis TaxID=981085 RepID=W9RZH6_9ROSA|nr:uncharacterized protein LOC21387634 [Morus notabilis]EXC19412.1 hypothetical protein L484_004127 [Morus notabilis]